MGLVLGQQDALVVLKEWFWDDTKGKETATLEGWAGTGKTFLVQYLIKELGINERKVLVSAPTNRAKSVIEELSGYTGKTVHSLLGLQLDLDLADFSPMNPIFNPKRPPDVNYRIIVIDESSMINKELYKKLKELAEEHKVKMLFMGDRYQLPPINEKVSKVFTDSSYKAVLTEIVRQGKDNPNGELIKLCITDIQDGTHLVDDFIKNNFQDINPQELNKSKGFVYVPDSKYTAQEYFRADQNNILTNKSKYLAYTNSNVQKTISSLRRSVFNFNNFLNVGESIVGYRGVSIKRGKTINTIIVNSEEYTIEDLIKVTLKDGMKGFQALIQNRYTGHNRYVNIIDSTDSRTVEIYKSIVLDLHSVARARGRVFWVKYYDFVNTNLAFLDVFDFLGGREEKIKIKDIYYSYGITIHKSQGGTFINSFVNLRNINRCYDASDRKRLKYVALSRCANVNIIF